MPSDSNTTEEEFVSDPAVVASSSQQLHLLVVCPAGDQHATLYYRRYHRGSWDKYVNIFGVLKSPATAVALEDDRIDVVGIGTDRNIWHMNYDIDPHGWELLVSSEPFETVPVVVSWGADRLDIFAISASDGFISHKTWDGSNWAVWESLGQLPDKAQSTASFPSSSTQWMSPASTSSLTSWSPATGSVASNATASADGSELGTGAVAGIAVGASLAVAVTLVAGFWLWRKQRRKRESPHGWQPGNAATSTSAKVETVEHISHVSPPCELPEDQMSQMLMSNVVHELGDAHDQAQTVISSTPVPGETRSARQVVTS